MISGINFFKQDQAFQEAENNIGQCIEEVYIPNLH